MSYSNVLRESEAGLRASWLLVFALLGLGCSDEGEPGTIIVRNETAPAAHGWANVWSDGGGATKGGASADAAHTYTVSDRSELVRALYPDAVIADDGSFTSENGPDPTPKLIYVRGTISLSSNAAGRELVLEDYACEGYDFEAYQAAYNPAEWNKVLVDGAPREILPCPGTQEELRRCSLQRQRAVVELDVGSNTSLIGLGSDARIIHGGLVIGGPLPSGAPPQTGPAALDPELAEACGIQLPPGPAPAQEAAPAPAPVAEVVPTAENVIVRNITFEDAFDMFPAWTPDDSYSDPPGSADPGAPYPLCQAAYDAASGAGPHQCPGGRWNSQYDNLRVQNARHVWIDHCTFTDGERGPQDSVWQAPYDQYASRVQPHDGALDINGYSDFVTVSRNVFRNHDKVMLIGGSDTVRPSNGWGALSVTVHHNLFSNVGQRLPRVRFGKVHVFSNFIEGSLAPESDTPAEREGRPSPAYPLGSGLAIGHLAKVYSENNVYELSGYPGDAEPTARDAVQVAHRVTPAEGTSPDVNEQTYFFDSGSLLNGEPAELMAAAQERAADGDRPELLPTESVWRPEDSYAYGLTDAEDVKADVERSAGAGRMRMSAAQ